MKAFMNGMMAPFTTCWQPPMESCSPANTTRYSCFDQHPAVVSPGRSRNISHPNSSSREVDASHGESAATVDVEKPHANDVLCGRGGSSNRHLGNMHFRELVAANKQTYVGLTKKQKMLVARKIVDLVGRTNPPGRFLAKDYASGLWYDIGVPRSLEKTSQALREKNSNDVPDVAQSSGSGSAVHASIKEESCKSKDSRSVEAPPLVVPSHLKEIYCQEKMPVSERTGWPSHDSQVPRMRQPRLRSPSLNCPISPPHNYHHISPQMRDPRRMDSPSSPHFGARQYPHIESSMIDYRDHYEYYGRSERQYGQIHSRLQPPRRYQPYPQTPVHHQMPIHHQHRQSPRTVTASPQIVAPSTPRRYHFDNDPCGFGRPYLPSSPPSRPISVPTSSPVAYRPSSSHFMRRRPNASPGRTEDSKRQRNEYGVPRLSDGSLSAKVQDSLSLYENSQGDRSFEIKSPSGLLQGRENRSSMKSGSEKVEANSQAGFSGLAALSTAAFLKLDETPLS